MFKPIPNKNNIEMEIYDLQDVPYVIHAFIEQGYNINLENRKDANGDTVYVLTCIIPQD